MSRPPESPSDASYDDDVPGRSTAAARAAPAVAAPGGRFPGAPLRVATSPDTRESLSPAQDAPGGEWPPHSSQRRSAAAPPSSGRSPSGPGGHAA